MSGFKPSFGSDNHSGVHPKVLESLVSVNISHAPSYGTDQLTNQVAMRFREMFGDKCQPFFVFNGTAANVLCIRSLIPSWRSVICSDISHLNIDECGAPEAMAGVKLQIAPSHNGKLQAQDLRNLMIRNGDQHYSSPGMISITQPTELGTVYSLGELKEIREFASRYNLLVHVDGARLSNSLITLECSFGDLIEALKPDAISFGGTKNGLLGAEAVLLFDSDRAKDFKFIRKQNMQLPSKSRFLAAQFEAYFESNLYLDIAKHSHQMAKKLEQAISEIAEINVLYPVESNAVFATIPKAWTKKLRNSMHFYVWDEMEWSIRLMCSFDTSENDIQKFTDVAQTLSKEGDS